MLVAGYEFRPTI